MPRSSLFLDSCDRSPVAEVMPLTDLPMSCPISLAHRYPCEERMDGRKAATQSPLHAALRFRDGQPMIYSTIANRMFLQINDSLTEPLFVEITSGMEECLKCEDWEPWEEPRLN